MIKNKKFQLAIISAKFLNKKYKLGKTDCFKLIYDFLQEYNVLMPTSFENITLDTYVNCYQQNSKLTQEIALRFFASFMKEYDHSSLSGDILYLQYLKTKKTFFGINAGCGNILSSSEEYGVITLPRRYYKVLRIYRWR